MKTYHILNLGAGVQSTALYMMSMRRDEPEHVPAFDCAIFADTQNEPESVYRHVEWLQSLGGPPILVRTRGDLFHDLLHGFERKSRSGETVLGHKSIPAFLLKPDGSQGLLGRHCTGLYKVDVVEATIKREVLGIPFRGRFPHGDVEVFQYFGLSYDEPTRVIKTTNRVNKAGWARPMFPLFAMEMVRGDCARYNEAVVPHPVPRSACKACPLRNNEGWRDMRDNAPAEFEEACRIDEAIRAPGAKCSEGLDSVPFLHRSMVPLRYAPIDLPVPEDGVGFAADCEGLCGV